MTPFDSVPVAKKGRTLFDESHEVSGTFPLSYANPVFCTETIPGDSWNINVFNTTKLETLIAPAMQRVNASLMWFKAPKRLLFRHFKKWYSGGEDGEDKHEKPHIYLMQFAKDLLTFCNSKSMTPAQILNFTNDLFGPGSLWNYLALPVPLSYNSNTGAWTVTSLMLWQIPLNESDRKSESNYIDIMPIMFYHMIYDQYFRDQTLSQKAYEDADEGVLKVQEDYHKRWTDSNGTSFTFGSVSGVDLAEGGEVATMDLVRLLFKFKRAWKKDYYTSALPTPQRGPEVTIGITEEEAPVSLTGSGELTYRAENASTQTVIDSATTPELDRAADEQSDHKFNLVVEDTDGGYHQVGLADVQGLTADLSGLSPITISAFRNLFKLQAFLEKNNVAGGRYIETILAHWAERVPDFTVQRAQHIRSTSMPVQISEVTATAYSSGVQAQLGDQAGRAKTVGNLGRLHVYTQEPSFIMGLYVVGAPPKYAGQGIPKMYQRITRFDEPWTDFQHIGEQAIKNRELYYDFRSATPEYNNGDFGYQQRFSEFKYMPDRVVGYFQTSLAYWHMARMFSAPPALNGQFVEQNLDERIFAIQNDHPVTADFYFQITAKRKLSKFSTPKIS